MITLKGTSDIILPMLMPKTSYNRIGWYLNKLYFYTTPDTSKPLRKDDDTTAGSFSNTSLTYDSQSSAVIGHADFRTQALAGSANTLRQTMLYWTMLLDVSGSQIPVDEATFREKMNDFDMSQTGDKVILVNINIRRR